MPAASLPTREEGDVRIDVVGEPTCEGIAELRGAEAGLATFFGAPAEAQTRELVPVLTTGNAGADLASGCGQGEAWRPGTYTVSERWPKVSVRR